MSKCLPKQIYGYLRSQSDRKYISVQLYITDICYVTGMEPEYHCTLPEGKQRNLSIPPNPVDPTKLHSCKVYVNYSAETNQTESCPQGWTYEGDLYTIVNEVHTVLILSELH